MHIFTTIMSYYSQIGIWDIENRNSIPLFLSGEERVNFGFRGVNVLTSNEVDIFVTVLDYKSFRANAAFAENYVAIASGMIMVGGLGLMVGNNEVNNNYIALEIPRGQLKIEVRVDSLDEARKVLFIFKSSQEEVHIQ